MKRNQTVRLPVFKSGCVVLAITLLALPSAAWSADDAGLHGRVTNPGTLAGEANALFSLAESTIVKLDARPIPGMPQEVVVPIEGELLTLELVPHSIRAAGYQVLVQVEGGAYVPAEPGPVRTMRGRVIEFEDAIVAASISDAGLSARVLLPDGREYWIEPLADRLAAADRDDHVLYRGVDIISGDKTCGLDLLENPHVEEEDGGSAGGTREACGDGILCVAELACDADVQFFNQYGSVSGVEARINQVINQVNVQYERDVEITHQITTIIVRTSSASNPYSTNDSSSLLGQFRSHWNANHDDIQRDLAELFTGRNLTGSVIGIAWVGAVCTASGYSVVESNCCGSLGCATDLSAHELGHNWNADHCACSQYTMNAGLTCRNQFHPTQTIPQISNYRNNRQFCLSAGGPSNGYCAATGTSTNQEHIARVQAGTIDNATGSSGYADFFDVDTDMEIGEPYTVTVTVGNTSSSAIGGLWIDWNVDGDFDDADEAITTSWSGSGPYQVTVVPPAFANVTLTRLRVRVHDANQTPSMNPCGDAQFGEVEDYGIHVLEAVCDEPVFVTQPEASQFICEGGDASLSVGVAPGNLAYQWRRGTNALTDDGAHIFGATTATLSIVGLTVADDASNYNCLVTNVDDNCPAPSANAEIVVSTDLPEVTSPPANQTVDEGDFAIFQIVLSEPSFGFDFQWRHNGADLVDDGRIAGANTDTLLIGSALPSDAGAYDCAIVKQLNGCATTSVSASLNVNAAPPNCPGDLNGDEFIDFDDLNEMLAVYGLDSSDPGFDPDADLNDDNVIDFDDLNELLAIYQTTCP